jgi:hypothetical protein
MAAALGALEELAAFSGAGVENSSPSMDAD